MTRRVMVAHGKGQRRPRECRGRMRRGSWRGKSDIPACCYFEGSGAGVWLAPGASSLVCGLWPAPLGGSQLRLVTVRLDRVTVHSILQHRRENIEHIGSGGLVLTISDVLERDRPLCASWPMVPWLAPVSES